MFEFNSQVEVASLSTMNNSHAEECAYFLDLTLTSFGGVFVRVVERGDKDKPERCVFLAPADADGIAEARMFADAAEQARARGEELGERGSK